jgi:anti-anti-sigma regulatory factor
MSPSGCAASSRTGRCGSWSTSEVAYLDSAGINLLYAVGSELRARQQELHLVVVPGSPIERTLAIVGANRAFPVHANRDEALAT